MPDTDTYADSDRVPIGDAARIAGVNVHTLRRWEREGRIKALRTPGNQRRYLVSEVRGLLNEPTA